MLWQYNRGGSGRPFFSSDKAVSASVVDIMASKQTFKQGEKVMFGIFGAFIVAAVLGYIALETIRHNIDKPMYKVTTHFKLSAEGHKGSALFREKRCTSCHRAMRNGTNMGLSLDGAGSKRTVDWILAFLHEPEQMYGSTTLDHGASPKEASYVAKISDADLKSISIFLSELISDQGSPSSPMPPAGKSGFIDGALKMVAPIDWKEKYTDIREQKNDAVEGVEQNATEK